MTTTKWCLVVAAAFGVFALHQARRAILMSRRWYLYQHGPSHQDDRQALALRAGLRAGIALIIAAVIALAVA